MKQLYKQSENIYTIVLFWSKGQNMKATLEPGGT